MAAKQSSEDPLYQWAFHRFELIEEQKPPCLPPIATLCSACKSIFSSKLHFQPLRSPESKDEYIRDRFPLTLGQMIDNAERDVCAVCFLAVQSLYHYRGGSIEKLSLACMMRLFLSVFGLAGAESDLEG